MESSAPNEARARLSLASPTLRRTDTLDFASIMNGPLPYPRYHNRQSAQHASGHNAGADGALPALDACSHSSMPTFAFPNNSTLSTPKQKESAKYSQASQPSTDHFHVVGAQQAPVSHTDRLAHVPTTHHRNALPQATSRASTRVPVRASARASAHVPVHVPFVRNAHVMASSVLPQSSPSPYNSQTIPNFHQFTRKVQSDAPDRALNSPHSHHQPYTLPRDLSGTQDNTHFHNTLQGVPHLAKPSSAPASSSAVLYQLHPVQNAPPIHSSSSLATMAVTQVNPNSFPQLSGSFVTSQPCNAANIFTTGIAPALDNVIGRSGTQKTAHLTKDAMRIQQPQQMHPSCETPLPNHLRTCTNLRSPATQVATMNPVSSVPGVPKVLPGPGHAMVTGHHYIGVFSHVGDSAQCLASVPVPDLPPRHVAINGGTRNMGPTLPPGYMLHSSSSVQNAAAMILPGSRTLGQMPATEPTNAVRLKQSSQRNRKRARGAGSDGYADNNVAGSAAMHATPVRKEMRTVAQPTPRRRQNNDSNTAGQCRRKVVTASALPTSDNHSTAVPLQPRGGKGERIRRKRNRQTTGVHESATQELQTSTEPHSHAGASSVSAIQPQHPGSLPSTTTLREGATDSNEEMRGISLSPCDEDEELSGSRVNVMDLGCVKTRSRSEVKRPTKRRHDLPLSLRVRAPTNAYSPVSDDTQSPLTPRSSGDHSTEASNIGEAGQETMEKNSDKLKPTPGAASMTAKENGRLRCGPGLTAKPGSSARQGMRKDIMKIPLQLRIRKPKGKASKRSNTLKRATASKRSTPFKPSRKRQVLDASLAQGTESHSIAETRVRRPSRLLAKSRTLLTGNTEPKRTSSDSCEVAMKKTVPLPVRRIEGSNGKAMETLLRKTRISDVPAFTPVPVQASRRNLSDTANKFETELNKVRKEGSLKRDLSHSFAGDAQTFRCSLCTDSIRGSEATVHPKFSADKFFLCTSCYKLVESRIKAEKPNRCEVITDAPEAVLQRTTLFVMVVENIVQAFPPTERESRDIANIHACVSSRTPLQLQERAKFMKMPFQIVALLRVVLRRLGVTIQRSRLRWRMQPIRVPTSADIVEIINQAIPPSLEDMVSGSTPSQRVWNTVFPDTKLESNLSAFDIVSKLLGLIGIRLHHLCDKNGNRCLGEDCCQVQFDLLSICAAMHRAFVMVSGTVTEKLFKIWNPHVAKRFLQVADTRFANRTLPDKLPNVCSVCALRKHRENCPFSFYSCGNCGHEFCSVCMSNVVGPAEFALACTGDYKCLLCREDTRNQEKLLPSGGQQESLSKPKLSNTIVGQNSSRMKPQLPMLILSSSIRKRLLSSAESEVDAADIGFAKFCEEANEHTCKACPSSTDAHLPTSAFPIRDAAIPESRTGDVRERCFGCKLPVDMPGPREVNDSVHDDDEPTVLRCVSDNCGVVMHRECSPIEQSRRRRVGRPKWICPRHRCQECAYRDDSRLFKCRTCPRTFCKDHMHKPSEVYIYSEKLFACVQCMGKLNPPRPCPIEKLPKRKNEFTHNLNFPQSKRRRRSETGSSAGMPIPYPGCIE